MFTVRLMRRMRQGFIEQDGVWHYSVWAPLQAHPTLLLEGRSPLPLKKTEGGHFEATVLGISDGQRYSIVLDDGREIPDPASARQPDGVHGRSQVFDPRLYAWKDRGWRGRSLEELVFYELHVGTFTSEGTLDSAAQRLEELRELGITCVEPMPLQPFPGKRNWGYDGVSLYAVHEAYGGPAALQRFVDRAHGLGVAVCLDVVFNHLGPEGNYLSPLGAYFTPRHHSPWGDALDFDGASSGPVRAFFLDAAVRWVRDFHVDGLRLDATHAIVDGSESHLVADVVREVERAGSELGRTVHVVAESDTDDRKVLDPPPAGWGCSAVWADDLHHALHALLTGERDRFFADYGDPSYVVRALTAGFAYRGERSVYRDRPHGTSTEGLLPSRFVTCLQNHDQVGNRPFGERISTLVPWEALAPLGAVVLLGSGTPLLFMGEEYGETHPFLYFTSHGDPELARAVSQGRRSEFIATGAGEVPDPQDPLTFESSRLSHRRDGRHGELCQTYRALLATRKRHLAKIAEHFPEVRCEGRVFTISRPGLTVRANLSPVPAGGLKAFGWTVSQTR